MTTKTLQSITLPIKDETTGTVENVTYTLPSPDVTLTTPGKSADAKVTGDKIQELTPHVRNGVLCFDITGS